MIHCLGCWCSCPNKSRALMAVSVHNILMSKTKACFLPPFAWFYDRYWVSVTKLLLMKYRFSGDTKTLIIFICTHEFTQPFVRLSETHTSSCLLHMSVHAYVSLHINARAWCKQTLRADQETERGGEKCLSFITIHIASLICVHSVWCVPTNIIHHAEIV